MKKLLAALLFVFSFSAGAQNSFIEVTVNDTVYVKPVSVEVLLSVEIDPEIYLKFADDEKYDFKPEEEKLKTKLKETLEKNGYKPVLTDSDDTFSVKISAKGQMEKLRAFIKEFGHASISIGKVDYGAGQNEGEKRLMEKLMAHARTKTLAIAEATGQKPMEITFLKELDNLNGAELNIYDTYFVVDTSETAERNGVVYGVLNKGVVVRFKTQ